MSRASLNRPSQNAPSVHSVHLALALEKAHRAEMGARIRELRQRSPLTQQQAADAIDVRLRTWARYEENGTTKWEVAEKIAEIFDTTPRWIWDGSQNSDTPDLMGAGQLDRMEAKLDRLLDEWAAWRSELDVAELSRQADRPAAPKQASKRKMG